MASENAGGRKMLNLREVRCCVKRGRLFGAEMHLQRASCS